jgi:hypothetical protein
VWLVLPYQDQLVRVVIGKRRQHYSLDNAEHRSGRADAKSKRKDNYCSESRRFAQHAHAVPHVLRQSLYQVDATGLAAFFFDLVRAAKKKASTTPGFRRGHAGLDKFLDLLLKMKEQLIVQFALHGATPEKRAETALNLAHHLSLKKAIHAVLLRRFQYLGHGGR